MTTALLWLRRDLRLHDHPALHAARDGAERMIPVFCFDDGLLERPPRLRPADAVPARVPARARRRAARARQPAVRAPRPSRRASCAQLARDVGADVGPLHRRRRAVRPPAPGGGQARRWRRSASPRSPTRACSRSTRWSRSGPARAGPTPCSRRSTRTGWASRGATCSARRARCRDRPQGDRRARCPRSRISACSRSSSAPMPGGEAAGREALRRFLAGPIDDYADGRDILTGESVSRLSPYLHFGCLSPREIEERLRRRRGRARPSGVSSAGATSTPTCSATSRRTPRSEYQERYRGTIRWSHAETALRGLVRGPDRVSRRSTPGCASCAARGGCTTAPGCSSARF